MNRELGTVRGINPARGYGLVTRDAGGMVPVDGRALAGSGIVTLHEGERLTFVVVTGDRGLELRHPARPARFD